MSSLLGWVVNGQVGNFITGGNSIPGNDLGWTPMPLPGCRLARRTPGHGNSGLGGDVAR